MVPGHCNWLHLHSHLPNTAVCSCRHSHECGDRRLRARWLTFHHDHIDVNGADGWLGETLAFLQDAGDFTGWDPVVRFGPKCHQLPHCHTCGEEDSWSVASRSDAVVASPRRHPLCPLAAWDAHDSCFHPLEIHLFSSHIIVATYSFPPFSSC